MLKTVEIKYNAQIDDVEIIPQDCPLVIKDGKKIKIKHNKKDKDAQVVIPFEIWNHGSGWNSMILTYEEE